MTSYHYTECGLDNVYLVNGYKIDGDGNLFIEDIGGLHKSIACKLLYLGRKFKGKEIRYIRHYLDLSQKTLGKLLGVDYQSVLRWETSKSKITNTADKLLRVYLSDYLDEGSRARELIDRLSDLDNDRGEALFEMAHKKTGWKHAA